jgi:hypothetical protein
MIAGVMGYERRWGKDSHGRTIAGEVYVKILNLADHTAFVHRAGQLVKSQSVIAV